MTRSDARASEPRGATVKLDPERDEGGRQARLPQSFLLSEPRCVNVNAISADICEGIVVEQSSTPTLRDEAIW
ncbi:hypothetical protein AXG93_93s1310 [Marchantia polymorpha subsp. ruderalis]|uniref:Uncharacterized protein n=1 Tax=Marchantia polymorpha subsp. ruderalis TaxID=1480154 RepID=A0A176WUM9_MARPO|nr:hypothetical protein AXG93_93s1310 [Marchantia polymorpha subsp. ruderalis]